MVNGPILITGATGQVGSALLQHLPHASAPTRAQLDLANPASIRSYVRALRPAWIINPAAYTAVDQAETDREAAFAINAEAPRLLGEEAARLGARVIHFSTDYVFDGSKPQPYVETDATAPLSVYGASKLAGEQALAATGAAHIILRTSWIYAPTGRNFLRTILRLARERALSGQPLRIVADQHGAPTAAGDLAALTAHIVASEPDLAAAGGIFHATAAGETTWHGFAAEIIAHARCRHPATELADVQPSASSEYPTPAHRPANSRLNCDRLRNTFGQSLPDWREALGQVMASL